MLFSQDIEVHYPTTVMQRQYDGVEELNLRLYTLLRSMQQRFKDTAQNAVNSGLISTHGWLPDRVFTEPVPDERRGH